MNYLPRPGIVLVSICNMPVLVPLRSAYDACRQIKRIPIMWAIMWETLEKYGTLDKFVEIQQIISKKAPDEIRRKYESVCEQLCSLGFLVKQEDTES